MLRKKHVSIHQGKPAVCSPTKPTCLSQSPSECDHRHSCGDCPQMGRVARVQGEECEHDLHTNQAQQSSEGKKRCCTQSSSHGLSPESAASSAINHCSETTKWGYAASKAPQRGVDGSRYEVCSAAQVHGSVVAQPVAGVNEASTQRSLLSRRSLRYRWTCDRLHCFPPWP